MNALSSRCANSSSLLASSSRPAFPIAPFQRQHACRSSPLGLSRPCRGPPPPAAEKKKFGSFDEMLSSSEVPLLVDFYATWCGPCQMLAPILASLSKRLEGKVQVVKIDSDKYPAIASKYRVMALPTVILFKRGEPVDRIEGMLDEQQLFDRVSYHIAS